MTLSRVDGLWIRLIEGGWEWRGWLRWLILLLFLCLLVSPFYSIAIGDGFLIWSFRAIDFTAKRIVEDIPLERIWTSNDEWASE